MRYPRPHLIYIRHCLAHEGGKTKIQVFERRVEINARLNKMPPQCYTSGSSSRIRTQALLMICVVPLGFVECAAARVSYANVRFPPSSVFIHIVMSSRSLLSIVLSHLRSRIGVPRCDVITRILLQCVGLRLRALCIELLAKFAFAL